MSSSQALPAKRGARSEGLRHRFGRLRLKHIIAAATLVGALIAGLAILGPAAFLWQREELRRLEAETLMLLRANVDTTSFPSIAETLRLGHRLTTSTPVRGGTIVNVLGEDLGSFGMPPALTFAAVRRDGTQRMPTPSGAFLDVFFPPEATGLAHPLILRLDTAAVPAAIMARLVDKAGTVLLVTLIAGLAIAVVLSFAMVRPMLLLRDAATAATDNPARADAYRLGWTRRDEIGDAGRAFDLLLTTVSIVHQEDLAASQEAMQRSAFAMLTYDPGGRLTSANAAALSLFGVESLDELSRLTPDYVRIEGAAEGADISPIDLLEHGDVSQTVSVVTPKGPRRCFMSATTVRRKNSTVLRHMVSFLDLSRQFAIVEKLEGDCARLQDERVLWKQRVAEMRALFESCLAILSSVEVPATPAPSPLDPSAPIVLTDRIVNSWLAEAARGGLVETRLEHAALPAVRGDAEAVEAVFRQALLTVYTRSEVQRPALTVTGFVRDDGVALFEVSETASEARASKRIPGPASQAGSAIASMALTQSLAKAGGALATFGAPGRHSVTFTLPAAGGQSPPVEMPAMPERSSTRAYAGAPRG